MSSSLQLSLSGRVVDVLPNGVLVIEAVRDFTVGNDRQTVTLRGLVRPGDVARATPCCPRRSPASSCPSRARARWPTPARGPTPIVRLLLKVLSF